jgi:hypothetical protein
MEHFPDFQWVDLARGVLTGRPRAAMEDHLRDGCEKCLDAYALWLRLATFAEQERGLEVPESAVRVAESYFSSRAERKSDTPRDSWLSALMATLTFDSRQQPLLAGTRAGGGAAAHLLYSAGKFSIDLHVETVGRPERILLAGQIADGNKPDNPPQHVRLTLVSAEKELATFQTNEFGEFHCEFERHQDLMLLVAMEKEAIAIALDALFEPANRDMNTRSSS